MDSTEDDGAGLVDLEKVYRERIVPLRRVAEVIVGNPETARDVVQDAFARLVHQRGSFRRVGSLEGWVWRTVVNTARMQRRAAGRRPSFPLPDPESIPNGASSEVDERVRAAVALLPERQRLILFLRFYADLDYATIAEALDVSAGTVAATLSSARASLRRLLEEVPS